MKIRKNLAIPQGSFFVALVNNQIVLFTLCVMALMLIGGTWWWTHRNRYWLIETKTTGKVRPRIVQLPLQHIENVKLRREIKIFNRMYLVLPSVNGVAVAYRTQMTALLRDPKHRPTADPYERLLYGYACYVLSQKLSDEVTRRQLQRNLLFLLAPKRKIVKKMPVTWVRKNYTPKPPIYKLWQDCYVDPLQAGIASHVPWQIKVQDSYIKYYHDDVVVKRYAHAYTLQAPTTQTVTLKVAPDKTDFACEVNRGVVTCRHLPSGETHTYAVRGGQVRLATSLCAKTDALEIYVTWSGNAKICLDGGQPRALTQNEIADNRRLERLATTAYQAQCVTGEHLRARYLAALKLVPTLNGLTRVLLIRNQTEFAHVWSALEDYRRLARLFHGFSLVLLYSSAASDVADVIMSTLNTDTLTACHQDQLWLYLIDRTMTEPDALYYLNKMAQGGRYVAPAPTPAGLAVTKNWPYVKTLTVTNTLPQRMSRDLVVPLVFNHLSVVSAHGSILTVVGLTSGYVSTYVLPAPVTLVGEWVTKQINIPLKVRLAGYETRQFTITRRENQAKARLTKKDLATAISAIEIHTDDKKLDALFTKPVVDGEDVGILNAVKAAYQNQDRKLLLVALSDRHQITMDVWQYLLTQIVGLRVRAGKIYLAPCVNLMGEFTIAFVCEKQQYQFNTRKKLSTSANFATIKYGNSNG